MAFGQGHHCRIRQGLQRAARIITIHITVYGLVGRCKASVIPISIHQTFHAGTFQNSGKLSIFPVRIQIITNRLTLEHIITVTLRSTYLQRKYGTGGRDAVARMGSLDNLYLPFYQKELDVNPLLVPDQNQAYIIY